MPKSNHRREVMSAVIAVSIGAVGAIAPALATLPLPPYPLCGSAKDQNAQNCPNDFGDPWEYRSYVPSPQEILVRPQELDMGTGISLDRAFALEVGSFDVTIAALDSGYQWDEGNTRRKIRLNTAELPKPQLANGTTSSSYDTDGDGVVTVDDYKNDARVSITAGNDLSDDRLDASDLLKTFSDGTDADANGYIDDIAGWDFLWNDNDAFDDSESQGYSHGTLTLRRAVAEGGDGGSMGSCPNCSAIPLRVGDSFIGESTAYAQAIVYAVDRGAKVIQLEIGGISTSALAREAIEYAWSKGVTIIASAADEASIHANEPSARHHTIPVHPVTYDEASAEESNSFQVFNNCADFGGRPVLSVSIDACSSEATAIGAGLAGLVHSAALHNGLSLTANEAYQLLTQNVDDIYVPEAYATELDWYPSKPGFDRYFGYGRVNIGRTIEAIYDGNIPPEADLFSPDWFQVIDPARTPVVNVTGYANASRSSKYRYSVEYGIGLDPTVFTTIYTSGDRTIPLTGTLTTWDLRQIPSTAFNPSAAIPPFSVDDDNVTRMDKINVPTVTLRVRVTDASGLTAEMRKTLYLRTDPDLLTGFPKEMGGSLEASPRIADLDGDGKAEIIQATSSGEVHVLKADGSSLTGFPVKANRLRMLDPNVPGSHAGAPAYKSGAINVDKRQSITSAVAVGDLDKDGKLEIVAATFDGQVFAWRSTGALMSGFPVSLDYSKATQATAGPTNLIEDGFFVAPSLGDINGDGYLDIVAGGMDQYAYAWDRTGKAIAGWPVLCKYPGRSVVPTNGARIMTPPAIGDVNNDGMMDVVIGTAEFVNYVYSPTYLIHGDGNNHRGGPFHKGWPILTLGLYANLLPMVGSGTTSAPALADVDGDGFLEVASHTIASYTSARMGSLYRYDGSIFSKLEYSGKTFGALSNMDEPAIYPLLTSGAFGDVDRDGSLDYAMGVAGASYLGNFISSNKIVNVAFGTAVWDAESGVLLPGFPQAVPDMQFFMHQAIADITGDGFPEVMSTNGAFTVDAFDADGTIPTGWPKFTGQWGVATPAVGDLNGDGLLEVVVGTRTGYLYAWKTKGKTAATGGVVEWGTYHHDNYNSGNYGTVAQTVSRATPAARSGAARTRP